MSGRHRVPRQYFDEPRRFRDDPPLPHVRARSVSPRRLEAELSSRRAEIRRIREDNQRLADEIVNLRQTMPCVKADLHVLSQAIPKHRAEKELESRELIQRNLKLEAELRTLDPLRQDALHLRSEAGKLQSLKQELSAKVQGLLKELEHQKSESQKIPDMIADRDALRQELIETRAALEYEKKAKPELAAQVQAMEKDLVAMAQEAEKLRADIAKRRAPTARDLMEHLCQHLGWVCKASMMVVILQLGVAMALGLGDRMIPMVTNTNSCCAFDAYSSLDSPLS